MTRERASERSYMMPRDVTWMMWKREKRGEEKRGMEGGCASVGGCCMPRVKGGVKGAGAFERRRRTQGITAVRSTNGGYVAALPKDSSFGAFYLGLTRIHILAPSLCMHGASLCLAGFSRSLPSLFCASSSSSLVASILLSLLLYFALALPPLRRIRTKERERETRAPLVNI